MCAGGIGGKCLTLTTVGRNTLRVCIVWCFCRLFLSPFRVWKRDYRISKAMIPLPSCFPTISTLYHVNFYHIYLEPCLRCRSGCPTCGLFWYRWRHWRQTWQAQLSDQLSATENLFVNILVRLYYLNILFNSIILTLTSINGLTAEVFTLFGYRSTSSVLSR